MVVHGPLSLDSPTLLFLKQSTAFLQVMTVTRRPEASALPVYTQKSAPMTTLNHQETIKSLSSTDLVCIITMLDALLLHKGGPTKLAVEEKLADDMIAISFMGIKTLNQAANLDLKMTQVIS